MNTRIEDSGWPYTIWIFKPDKHHNSIFTLYRQLQAEFNLKRTVEVRM